MHVSGVQFVVSLIVSQRLRKFCKDNKLPEWERFFKRSLFFSVFLFIVEMSLSADYITRWIWHIYLIGLIGFCLKQKELKQLRMLFWSFAPIILFSFLKDLVEVTSHELFKKWDSYFDIGILVSFIWLIAIFFSHNRQMKIMEKERIKRLHEDELNRAIAIRKVELEGLVAERTAELMEQKEELQHAITELRTTQTQLIQSEKMASLGELTAGIAHEIQNPLNFVNNFSELNIELSAELKEELVKLGLPEDARINLEEIIDDIIRNEEKINHHGKRADSIIKGMLQHSRASSGKKEPTDINSLVDEYLRLSYHGLRAKDKSFNASFQTNFDETIGKINIISQDIGRVILNLFTNAFYSVSEKKKLNSSGYEPTVYVQTKKAGDKVEIVIRDNGTGIPQKLIDKIFQPFFTTKPTGQGTGLGLSLSFDIIAKGHGGELKVNSKEGEYAEFIIILPI